MGFFKHIASSFIKDRVSNTTTAFQLIIADFKRYVLILKYSFLAISLGTVIFGIITQTGNLIINCCLLGLLVVYAILDAILRKKEMVNPTKKVRLVYAWLKIILNAAALASSLYSLYSATASDVKPFSIVLATLSMIMFIIKVVVEICLDIFSSKWTLLKNAMMMDAKEHSKTSGKLFSPIIGDVEEVEIKESVANKINKWRNKNLK